MAEINGGQCSMFRLDALKDIYDKQKIEFNPLSKSIFLLI